MSGGGARVVNKLATVIDIVVPFLFDQDKGHGQWLVTHCLLHTVCYTLLHIVCYTLLHTAAKWL